MMLDQITERVPGIPRSANSDFDITSHGTLTAADRKILRISVAMASPGISREAVLGARTLGQLADLLNVADTAPSVPKYPRGDYRTDSYYMRPILHADYEQLYFAALEPSNAYRWRYRGRTPSMDEFVGGLSAGSLAEFVFARSDSNQLGAYCVAYEHDANAGHCAFAVQRLNFDRSFDTCVIESVGLFLNYLFETFALRKVFAHIPEYNFPSFGLLPDVFAREGERSDYYWHGGRFWSEITISTTREDWAAFATGYFE
jgi:hypothetical protein